jgi:tight adherence protein C
MLNLLYTKLTDSQFMFAVLVGIATVAAIISAAMPLFETDTLGRRIKAAGSERDRIRARERERLSKGATKISLRQEPKAYMKNIVERFGLSKWLGTEQAKMQMTMAGFRGQQTEIAFLFFRFVAPIGCFLLAVFYVFILEVADWSFTTKLAVAMGAAYAGLKAPEIYLKNAITKRQQSMRRAFPDALDLLLICVESGISIEHAFRKVSQEIGVQSIPLAEEFTLATAELSFLPDRRSAYENFALRTGLDSVKQIVTVLVQSERYGTSLGSSLRVVAQESRDQRMLAAEKKAAALPPKLTVPMILFFLPVLFAVIITPAVIQISNT